MTPPPPSSFTLYAERGDRLTSRLQGLLGVWRFARCIGRRTAIYWPPRKDQDYSVASVFDLEAMSRDPVSGDLTIINGKYAPRENTLELDDLPGWPGGLNPTILSKTPGDFYVRSQAEIQGRWEKRAEIEREKKILYGLLKPHPVILNNLQRALDWIGPDGFTAVHIRRGDLITTLEAKMHRYEFRRRKQNPFPPAEIREAERQLYDWVNHFVVRAAPVDAYVEAWRSSLAKDSRQRVIVFSDSDSSALEFQQRCDDHPTLLMSSFKTELSEIQRAYLEVLVLTRARHIISTGSTYGKFASFYGAGSFADVRTFCSKKGMRDFFAGTFAVKLQDSHLRETCERMLEVSMGRGKVLRSLGLGFLAPHPWLQK